MTASLGDLLALQDVDLALDQLRHRRAHLPERAEIADVDAQRTAVGTELAAVQQQLDGLATRQAEAEAELAATEKRAGSVNQRLYGGEVTASRDLQAMSAELESLKARASVLEDTVLEVFEAREPLDLSASSLASRMAELAERREELAGRLSAAEVAVDKEIAEDEARRAEASAAVDPSLLATYERLRTRLGGVGVARLVGNHCDGCHLTLSAVELEQVRHLPEGEVYTCEQCGRILVP